jgi:hypothetical protein
MTLAVLRKFSQCVPPPPLVAVVDNMFADTTVIAKILRPWEQCKLPNLGDDILDYYQCSPVHGDGYNHDAFGTDAENG